MFNNYRGDISTAPCKDCLNREVIDGVKCCEKNCAKWIAYKRELYLAKEAIKKDKILKYQARENLWN